MEAWNYRSDRVCFAFGRLFRISRNWRETLCNKVGGALLYFASLSDWVTLTFVDIGLWKRSVFRGLLTITSSHSLMLMRRFIHVPLSLIVIILGFGRECVLSFSINGGNAHAVRRVTSISSFVTSSCSPISSAAKRSRLWTLNAWPLGNHEMIVESKPQSSAVSSNLCSFQGNWFGSTCRGDADAVVMVGEWRQSFSFVLKKVWL